MEKLLLNCDQCGSVEVELIDDSVAKCSHCGAKFLIIPKKGENEDEIDDLEPLQGAYAIKPIRDMEWFKRKAIIDLFLDSSTPLDISEATLGEPYENITQSLITTVAYDGECVADIGYRSPFASEYGDSDSDYMWEPFQGRFRTAVKSTMLIDRGANDGDFYRPILTADDVLFSCMKGELNADKYICTMQDLGVTPIELTENIIDNAVRDNKSDLADNISLPGDKQKIVSATGAHKVVSLIKVAEKQYILPGEYKGERFEIVAASGGDKEIIRHCKGYGSSHTKKGIYSLSELGVNGKKSKDYENQAWKAETEAEAKHRIYTSKRKRESQNASIFATCVGILGVVACSLSFLIGVLIIALSIAGYKGFMNLRNNHWEKLIAPCEKQIAEENPLKMPKEFCYKLKKLEKALADRGIAPITEEEIKGYLKKHIDYYKYSTLRTW